MKIKSNSYKRMEAILAIIRMVAAHNKRRKKLTTEEQAGYAWLMESYERTLSYLTEQERADLSKEIAAISK